MRLRGAFAMSILLIVGVSLLPGVAGAESVIVVNDRFEDFSQDRFNACNGETVTFEGVLHRVELLLPDGTSKILISVQVSGTGSLGNEYVIRGYHQITTQPNEAFLEVFRDRLITVGPAPDQHVLLIASGPPLTIFFEPECRG
jgi:hypothetical protein